MKKILAIAVIAASLTACNDKKKSEETLVTKDTTLVVTKDTTVISKDTMPVVTTTQTTVDTLKKVEGKMNDKKVEVKKP